MICVPLSQTFEREGVQLLPTLQEPPWWKRLKCLLTVDVASGLFALSWKQWGFLKRRSWKVGAYHDMLIRTSLWWKWGSEHSCKDYICPGYCNTLSQMQFQWVCTHVAMAFLVGWHLTEQRGDEFSLRNCSCSYKKKNNSVGSMHFWSQSLKWEMTWQGCFLARLIQKITQKKVSVSEFQTRRTAAAAPDSISRSFVTSLANLFVTFSDEKNLIILSCDLVVFFCFSVIHTSKQQQERS